MEDVKGCKIHENSSTKEDEIESTKLEMTGVREENTRLKSQLQQIEKDYKTLQRQFIDVFRQQSKKNIAAADDDDDQEQELVSLRLGTNKIIVPTETKTENIDDPPVKSSSTDHISDKKDGAAATELGLGYNNIPERLESKVRGGDEEICHTSVKRARVCVRARCDTPTMNDGCQWRKYGQKIAKGNPCPRAYYRCTVSPTCPVRKQVQRCMDDISILITTYEGTHNHPLPISATSMASTTSAAASMLLSGSSTSSPPPPPPAWTSPSSATTPFSTVTLDLTTNPAAAPHGGFSLYSSSSQQNPTTNLSFSPNMDSNNPSSAWGSGGGFSFNDILYNSNMLPAGKAAAQGQRYLSSYLERFNHASSSHQALTETLTKAITSDPSFRSVIAAVVSTMAANGKVNNGMFNGDQHLPAADSSSLSSK